MYNNRFPVDIHLRRPGNGDRVNVKSLVHAWLLAYGLNANVDGDKLTFTFEGKRLSFIYSDTYLGDLPGVFCKRIYEELNVCGREVLDIGSTVGDSVIFFLLEGAEKVIAVEPFPAAFAQLEKNIALNGFEDQVVLLNAAISDSNGNFTLDPTLLEVGSTPAHDSVNGLKVPKVTFEEVLSKLDGNNATVNEFSG